MGLVCLVCLGSGGSYLSFRSGGSIEFGGSSGPDLSVLLRGSGVLTLANFGYLLAVLSDQRVFS